MKRLRIVVAAQGGTLTSSPAVSPWALGRLGVFARGTDNAVYHKWFSGGWSGWESLGGGLLHPLGPAAVSWGFNRIDTFVVGIDSQLYHNGGHNR